MPALPSELRRQLENVCVAARDIAEAAARSALQKRAVDAAEPFAHFTAADKDLRTRLRARGRQAGDVRDERKKTQTIDQLTQELAYEYWHRMLFARFLAENHLLMHPDGVAVSLAECEELAQSEGAPNGFVLAARYASRMLPQVFRRDDVLLEIELAPEQRLTLEKLLASLPRDTFLADDSLGWVYQFWQTKRKDEVNKSGDKIDGRTLSAVTQLFTEDYMVQFLLHNTIGAWWAGKRFSIFDFGFPIRIEEDARRAVSLAGVQWEYLRFIRDDADADPSNPKSEIQNPKSPWLPAAGTFDGWPQTLREFTMLDPCCGSGHFLVNAFNLLVPLRMHDEGLSAAEACDAVLRDNLFGLELDPRCTQIAAFALALAAWRLPAEDGQPLGYRELPQLNIACSGQSVTGRRDEWLSLANGDSRLREGMDKLYDLFQQAADLGSLIDPRREGGDMFAAGFAELKPHLTRALSRETGKRDAEATAIGVAAQGISTAAEMLTRRYTLVATNVPFLGRTKQAAVVNDYAESHYPLGKHDLATVFYLRCIDLADAGCSTSIVIPQNWFFLGTYTGLRKHLIAGKSLNLLVKLGPAAFQDMNWWAANTSLVICTSARPTPASVLTGIDVSDNRDPFTKAGLLTTVQVASVSQLGQLTNPDHRIQFDEGSEGPLLDAYASGLQGVSTADLPRFVRLSWEVEMPDAEWVFFQGSADETTLYGGRECVLRLSDLEAKAGELGAAIRGRNVWGKHGVVVRQMRHLPATLYSGEPFDTNVAVILPKKDCYLLPIWAFCSSPVFHELVRKIDQKTNVTNATLVKVAVDLAHWQAVAAERYPDGLPKPFSSDPTQWLFDGFPAGSDDPLQVGVARLLGYRWPRQTGSSFPDCPALGPDGLESLADGDGLVPIPSVRGEPPAAERLQELLNVSCQLSVVSCQLPETGVPTNTNGPRTTDNIHSLLTAAGCKPGTSVDDWLRNGFFEQHCKRFHNRPFIWHIWDGRKDGFACLVNYHTLDHARLESLTYSYLGDWLRAQADDARAGKPGADLRLAAAQALQEKLKLILAGEPPYDIFVRWKPLSEQAIGWNPDLNDGVRMNIRPFVQAGILRKNPNIKWTKDRGREPQRDSEEYPWFWDGDKFVGDRINDVHLTTAEKQAARNRKSHG